MAFGRKKKSAAQAPVEVVVTSNPEPAAAMTPAVEIVPGSKNITLQFPEA